METTKEYKISKMDENGNWFTETLSVTLGPKDLEGDGRKILNDLFFEAERYLLVKMKHVFDPEVLRKKVEELNNERK